MGITPQLIFSFLGYAFLLWLAAMVLFIALAPVVAVIRVALYALSAAYFLLVGVVCVATYPITLALRLLGYNVRSIFSWHHDYWRSQDATWDATSTNSKKSGPKSSAEHAKSNRGHESTRPLPSNSFDTANKDPWQILGVPKGAPKDAITAAYRQMMMKNHPDRVANLDPELQTFATQRTILIKNAYEHLLRL